MFEKYKKNNENLIKENSYIKENLKKFHLILINLMNESKEKYLERKKFDIERNSLDKSEISKIKFFNFNENIIEKFGENVKN